MNHKKTALATRREKSGSYDHALQQLFRAKVDLANRIVEDAEHNLEQVIDVLRNKALSGDTRAIALYLDYTIEKSPQRLFIEATVTPDVSKMGEHELKQAIGWYLAKNGKENEGIVEHSPFMESHFKNSPPPLQEISVHTIPEFLESKPEDPNASQTLYEEWAEASSNQ